MNAERVPLLLCASADEAERLALRGFDAIDGTVARDNDFYKQYRSRLVIVTPGGRTSAYGAAAMLHTFRAKVEVMVNGADLDADDFMALPRKRFPGDDEPERSITVAAARLSPDWVETEQQPPPFVVPGLLPDQEAGSIVSPGGTLKTTLKLLESAHIIVGRDLYGRRILKPGVVLCVSKEDRKELIDYRLKMICRGLGLSDAEMRRVHRGFLRLDLRGDAFMLQRQGVERIPFRSGDVTDLLATFQGEGIVSVWFDTASRFATGEGNQESAISIDACTVLADGWHCVAELLHHVAQGIARSGTVDMHAGRGGTAFVDNGRFARQLVRHTADTLPNAIAYQPPPDIDPKAKDLFRMHVVKLTGARHDMHAPIWIERRSEWEFVCVESNTAGSRPTQQARKVAALSEQAGTDDAAVFAFVVEQLERKPPNRMTQNDLIGTRERIAAGMSQHRVREAVGRLKLDGKVIEAPIPGKVRGARLYLAPVGWQESLCQPEP